MKHLEPPRPRTWKEISAPFIGAGLCVLYGGLRMNAGVVGWRNYQRQPVTAFLVLALGVIFVVVGLLDVLIWNPQRRRVHEGWHGCRPRQNNPRGL
jgi:hypothetical protein